MNAMPKPEDAIPNDLKTTPEAGVALTCTDKEIARMAIDAVLSVVRWWNQVLREHQQPPLRHDNVGGLLRSSLDRVTALKSSDIGDHIERRIMGIVSEQFTTMLSSLQHSSSLRDIT